MVEHNAETSGAKLLDFRAAASFIMSRWQFFRQAGITFRGARDTYQILGYNRLLTVRDYRDRYARGGVAGTIIDALPNACWRGEMALSENDDPKQTTTFEKAWADFDKRLKVRKQFLRVDKLSRLSTFAVLLIGAPAAGDDLGQELPRGNGTPDGLLYLQPFIGGGGPGGDSRTSTTLMADADASVFEYDTDVRSLRFGLPKTYLLRRWNINAPMMQRPIHWSRIIHIAENALDDDVFGQPALERPWNLLDDLDKVTGGGAEAFWLRANQGTHIDIDKDLSLKDAEAEKASLAKQAEDYANQMTRWFRTRGVDIKTLGSDVANFSSPADAILTQIAGTVRMPKRILSGSEMGELASSQDRDNWNDQVNGRQTEHCDPNIVRNLVDRLVAYGYLPTPSKGVDAYDVIWPHKQTLTEAEKSTGALQWAETNKSQGSVVFTDDEIRDHWYGLPPLTEEQKLAATQEPPIEAPVRVDDKGNPIDATPKAKGSQPPPAVDKNGVPVPPDATQRAAEADIIRRLAQAIDDGNMDDVTALLWLPSGERGVPLVHADR